MSDDIPEREEIVRSSVITILLTVIFLVLALAFWAWSSPDVIDTSPIGALNSMNPFATIFIESLTMLVMFIFLSVTIINLRLFISNVRAGWFEVIFIFIIVAAMSWLMFGSGVGGVTAFMCLGFVVYLYLLQE